MAYHFAQVALAAIERAFTLRERIDLRRRAERLLRQFENMRPRGRHVTWWANPYRGEEVNGTSLNSTVSIDIPKPLAGGADTATSRRRRRT